MGNFVHELPSPLGITCWKFTNHSCKFIHKTGKSWQKLVKFYKDYLGLSFLMKLHKKVAQNLTSRDMISFESLYLLLDHKVQ